MTDEATFRAALDAEPDNVELRGVFADWLEERGDDRAAGYRWMYVNRKVPETFGGVDAHWNSKRVNRDYCRDASSWGRAIAATLPDDVYNELPPVHSHYLGYQHYPSIRAAELALCEAIHAINRRTARFGSEQLAAR